MYTEWTLLHVHVPQLFGQVFFFFFFFSKRRTTLISVFFFFLFFFLILPCFIEIPVFDADSEDPDEKLCCAASDLSLHCLPMSLRLRAVVSCCQRICQLLLFKVA